MTKAILITTENEISRVELPETNSLSILQQHVGGYIDAVRGEDIVGYVNDEGLLIGLDINAGASMLFGRLLVGNVVIVGGLNERGEYDGENHDTPSWLNELLLTQSV